MKAMNDIVLKRFKNGKVVSFEYYVDFLRNLKAFAAVSFHNIWALHYGKLNSLFFLLYFKRHSLVHLII